MSTETEIKEVFIALGLETQEQRDQYLKSLHLPPAEPERVRIVTTDSTIDHTCDVPATRNQ